MSFVIFAASVWPLARRLICVAYASSFELYWSRRGCVHLRFVRSLNSLKDDDGRPRLCKLVDGSAACDGPEDCRDAGCSVNTKFSFNQESFFSLNLSRCLVHASHFDLIVWNNFLNAPLDSLENIYVLLFTFVISSCKRFIRTLLSPLRLSFMRSKFHFSWETQKLHVW